MKSVLVIRSKITMTEFDDSGMQKVICNFLFLPVVLISLSGVICPSDSGVSLFTYASHPSLSDVARVSWRDT